MGPPSADLLGTVPQPPGTGACDLIGACHRRRGPSQYRPLLGSSGRDTYPTTTGGTDKAMSTVERSSTAVEVVLGVDTHLDSHVAVALDQLGRRLGALTVPTTAMGYQSLVSWAEGFGPVRCAGVEGTGSYGAGLARHFKTAGIPVMEVERPKKRHLRRN